MGGFSAKYCNFTPRNIEIVDVSFGAPKNKFERALNDKPSQTMAGYRVALLRGGHSSRQNFTTKCGKLTLTVKARVKNES